MSQPVLTSHKLLSIERQRLHSDNSPPALCLADMLPTLVYNCTPREGTIDHEIGPQDKTSPPGWPKDGGVGHSRGVPASRRIQARALKSCGLPCSICSHTPPGKYVLLGEIVLALIPLPAH